MSALSAAAQDEDGDIIKALQARIADLEAQLYSVGAGGVGKLTAQGVEDSALLGNIESPFNACMHQEHCKQWKQQAHHHEQHLNMVPAGWQLVPVEPTIPMLHRADGLTCIDFAALGEEGAFDLDELKEIYRAMLAAAPQPPVVEQQSNSDMVSVPRSLLGAACAGMRHRLQDAPKVLEQLRRYTVGDLSKSAVEQPQSVTDCHQSQPQGGQEPVAWINPGALEWGKRQCEKVLKLTRKAQPEYDFTKPLYTHPQPRQPLTVGQINRLIADGKLPLSGNPYEVARAIERAHGIGGEA